MGKWVVIPWVGGSIYNGRGSKYHEYEGRYTMDRGVKIPWVSGSKYRGKRDKIPWVSGSSYHGYSVKIPWIGGRYAMGRGSVYHG